MSQHSDGGGSADGGDQRGFDWLYGKGGKGGPTDDESTQVLPTGGSAGDDPTPTVRSERVRYDQPRPPQQPTAARLPREAPAPARGPAPAPEPTRRHGFPRFLRPRRPRILRVILLLFVVWLVFLVATPFLAWRQVEKVEFAPAGERPADQPGTNYLLVGSDSRAGLTAEQRRRLTTGNPQSQLADTIMILHTGSGPNLLMSLPRDSIVDIPGRGSGKINGAFSAGGPQLLTETIEANTGIYIDQYVEIGLGGFVEVIDAVDGITICPRKRMVDPLAGLNVKKGCQEAGGRKALAYSRSRKVANLGDIDRARRQREVVSAVGSKVASPWSILNPVRYWNLNQAATGFVRFGEGSSPLSAGRWAWGMTRVDGESGLTCGVPIRDLAVNWDEERSERMFAAIREDQTDSIPDDLCTGTGRLPGT